jgi:hypothetical protein
LPSIKRQKKLEALQELVHIKPDLKGKEVYFFPTLDKYFKGIIMYDGKEKKAYVYCIKSDRKFETFSQWINILKSQRLFKGNRSAIATIFWNQTPPVHQLPLFYVKQIITILESNIIDKSFRYSFVY